MFSFSQHFFFLIFFFSKGQGREELKSWTIVRKFLLLSDLMKQVVDKCFSLILISPSPTIKEGSVQALITYLTSFCIINSQIPFYPYWNSFLFFFQFVDLKCSFFLPSILFSPLPSLLFFTHPQTFQMNAVPMKHKTRSK